jgi:choline dehydrogenase-like flavoprotein
MKQFISSLSLSILLSISSLSLAVQNGCNSDYIIVGLGNAGAPLARYLSDVASVTVFEAGKNLALDPKVTSGEFAVAITTWTDPKYSLLQVPQYGQLVAGLFPIPYSDGRMWGGSSAHNGLITIRGSTDLYDSWASLSGNPQWAYSNVLPIMLWLEQYTPNGTTANPNQRGLTGPWYITQDPPINGYSFVVDYAAAVNAPLVNDYNDPTNGGANPAPNYLNIGVSANQNSVIPTTPTPTRSFSINAFLPESVIDYTTGQGKNGRPLQVVSSATVVKVLFNGTKAIGVEYILDGDREKVYTAFARKGVILCAGSIADAAILQRSGVGDATYLQSINIPVVIDNPNVGANMQNHFGPVGLVSLDENSLAPFVLCESFFGIAPDLSTRVVQAFFQRGTLLFPNPELARVLGVDTSNPFFAPVVSVPFQLVKNNSRGTVKIVNDDPLTQPHVDFNFYGDGQDDYTTPGTDAYNAVASLKLLQNIAGSSVIYPTPADYTAGDAALYNCALNTWLVQDHATGTCRMGTAAANGVVDGNLYVFGTQNTLLVCDCAIEPEINDGNTQYNPYVVALRLAKNLGANLPFN